MKKLLYLIPFLLFACQKQDKIKGNMVIDKNWEIEGLQLNHSTINDFEKFMQKKNITFIKDSVLFEKQTNDTLEYCGNDYSFPIATYQFSNEYLGLSFHFEKNYFSDSILFKSYDISKFDHIKLQQNYNRIISKTQLINEFSRDELTNLYEKKVQHNNIILGVVPLDKETYEIKILKVYQE